MRLRRAPPKAPGVMRTWLASYYPVPGPDGPTAHVARWALDGPVERWPIAGLEPFESIHDIRRAQKVGSVHTIISAAELRPYLISAVERGMARTLGGGSGLVDES